MLQVASEDVVRLEHTAQKGGAMAGGRSESVSGEGGGRSAGVEGIEGGGGRGGRDVPAIDSTSAENPGVGD